MAKKRFQVVEVTIVKLQLHKDKKIAFICSPRLGDSLIAMVVVNNLVLNEYQVDVFSDYLYELRSWFPWAKIFPALSLSSNQNMESMADYAVILHMYSSKLAEDLANWHERSLVLADSYLYKERMLQVDIQVAVCYEILGLDNVMRNNGIRGIPGLSLRGKSRRIVIHPTSSHKRKSWLSSKFIRLAEILEGQGWQPSFIVSQDERLMWQKLVKAEWLPYFSSLDEVASFIYEAAFFIGNDSGIGHLASSLGIPTLTLLLRPGVARQWRPGWSCSEVVLPPWWLITRPLKEKFWCYCVSVKKVLCQFNLLQKHCIENNNENMIVGRVKDNYFVCYAKYFNWKMRDFLHMPDKYLASSSGPFFKSAIGDTTTIGVAVISDQEFVIKRYNIKSVGHFLRKCWRRSKAKVSWENIHCLCQNGIATVTPVAMIELRTIFRLRSKAYFVTEYVHGTRGCDYFSMDATPTAQWQTVMHNIIVMMHKLYQAKIAHNDLQWGNILIVGEHPLLLDLDHMKVYKEHSKRYKRAWQRDVEHFKKFLAVNPSAYQLFCNEYAKYFANNSGPHDVGI